MLKFAQILKKFPSFYGIQFSQEATTRSRPNGASTIWKFFLECNCYKSRSAVYICSLWPGDEHHVVLLRRAEFQHFHNSKLFATSNSENIKISGQRHVSGRQQQIYAVKDLNKLNPSLYLITMGLSISESQSYSSAGKVCSRCDDKTTVNSHLRWDWEHRSWFGCGGKERLFYQAVNPVLQSMFLLFSSRPVLIWHTLFFVCLLAVKITKASGQLILCFTRDVLTHFSA